MAGMELAGMRRVASIATLLAVVVVLVLAGRGTGARAATRPNVLLIVTDDQRWDTLWSMPNVASDLVDHGVTFTSAHVVTPLCCPARASILTGQYAHTTGVYGNHNSEPNGGFNAFDDSTTIATVLHRQGYRTGLVGKYLNGYAESDADRPPTYVPPGWDDWRATIYDGGAYYGFTMNENGVERTYGATDYITDVLGEKAVEFIRAADGTRPWYLEWTPTAPHADAEVEADHAHDFDALAPWRPDSYNEADVSDKPAWLQAARPLSLKKQAGLDDFRRRQYGTLASVDDWVGAMVDALASTDQLRNTMIVYTSDNGFFWGEHRLSGKNLPYEEATRVPYVLRYDPLGGARTTPALATNLDLAPTFASLAGTSMPAADGKSLLPFLRGDVRVLRSSHLLEQQAVPSQGLPAWCQMAHANYRFIHYSTGEEEYYNLATDPLQLVNRIASPRAQHRIARMRDGVRALCDPLPPGMPAF
jgi:N-acetylglucosamine-6-sulfatase